jgi:hypothetical protein
MQITNVRYLVLTVSLLIGAALYVAFGQPLGSGTPRWPERQDIYAAELWTSGPIKVDHNENSGNHTDLVTRPFHNSDGTMATLTIVTNQAPKLYGAGAEVPFLGNGYTVEPAPQDLVAGAGGGISGIVAQRGTERWLVMFAYGERRGLLGNGALPWTLAMIDGIIGRPNDYYKLYLMAQIEPANAEKAQAVASLAGTLFPRIAAWYAG